MAASRTAEYVALFRAIESARPPAERSFDDPYAIGFLDPGLKSVAVAARVPGLRRLLPRIIDWKYPGARPSAVVRTGMIDGAVSEAFGLGAEQLAILGAGYDTRAIRLPAAIGKPAYELDQPETQERKAARLIGMNGALPGNVVFVPFNLEDEDVGGPLERGGFKPGLKTAVVWEGVLSYLTPEAVDATLAWVVAACAPGSRLVFTYVDVSLFADGAEDLPWKSAVAKVGEPFRYGLDHTTLDGFLDARGLKQIWDISTAEAIGDDSAPDFYRVALAEVAR